jgi:hypothetical protein
MKKLRVSKILNSNGDTKRGQLIESGRLIHMSERRPAIVFPQDALGQNGVRINYAPDGPRLRRVKVAG